MKSAIENRACAPDTAAYPDADIVEKAVALRHELHRHPELSNAESGTKNRLIGFIRANTSLEIRDMGRWFYAAYRAPGADERGGAGKHIAFRADMDALPVDEGDALPYSSENRGVSHKCGHDGHCASLAAFALSVDRHGCENSVFFLFQHAEETGAGANECAELIALEHIDEIYGYHNMPGFPLISVAVHDGTAACASRGLVLRFIGKNSHASQPENGRNPAFVLAKLIDSVDALTALSAKLDHDAGEADIRRAAETAFCADLMLGAVHGFSISPTGMVMCTVIGAEAGSRAEGGGVSAFGTGAGYARLMLTVRAEDEKRLDLLEKLLTARAVFLAGEEGLGFEKSIVEPFPETRNSAVCAEKVRRAAQSAGLPIARWDEPFRSSEDFGVYTKLVPGALFYIGCGEDHAPLHTACYDFEDALIPAAVRIFSLLAQ